MRVKATTVLAAALVLTVTTVVVASSSGLHTKHPSAGGSRERDSQALVVGGPISAPPENGRLEEETPHRHHHVSVVVGPTRHLGRAVQQEQQQRGLVSFSTKAAGGASRLQDFPTLKESTVMFLHVFKCAGTTLRRMLVDWAKDDGKSGAIIVDCDHIEIEDGKICLHNHDLIDDAIQEKDIAKQKVLAGHFMWGFQRHVHRPYLMITALRNPLEAFVSGQQFLHRDQTETLEQAAAFITWSMTSKLGYQIGATPEPGFDFQTLAKSESSRGNSTDLPKQRTGYMRRLIGITNKQIPQNRLPRCLKDAITNLETFWVVGVVEQYPGFEAVLTRLLDPEKQHAKLWKTYTTRRYNISPVTTPDILSVVDPDMVQEFNNSLALNWKLYARAVELWGGRCREILPIGAHRKMCTIPVAPQGYTHADES